MSEDYFFKKSVKTGTYLMEGNVAMAEGCLAAGCKFFAGYPITPQSEVPEHMSKRLPEVGGVFMQMEDEIASISAVVGAAITGKKAMSSTSGPGFALMQETLSWANLIEMPIVVANVQRVGPGSGVVSLPHQGDVTQIKRGGNGEYEVICIAPNSCQELFDLSIEAFNLAEKWRVPTFIMSDAWLGHLREKVVIPEPEEIKKRIVERREYVPKENETPGRPQIYTVANKDFTEFNIPAFPPLGSKDFPFWWISLTHSQISGMITETPSVADNTNMTINYKISKNEEKISIVKRYELDDAEIAIIAYGTPSRSALEAVKSCRKEGIKVGLLRLVTVWPIPETAIKDVAKRVKQIIVPEINLGQIAEQIERFAFHKDGQKIPVHRVSHTAILHNPQEIIAKIKEVSQ
ncbi:MAG: 2-oxoacid:acceptor oxidoreductase subunit alpha [Promethearchaeota archaeon]